MGHLARREGILIHTIYCGDAKQPDVESWKELAELTYGRFSSVDPRTLEAVPETPFDAQLAKLSRAINETYLPLGEEGRKRREMLTAQDEKARELSPAAAATRAQAKTSRIYSSGWDLVDAVEAETVDLYEVDETTLPESLRKMTPAEREDLVAEMHGKREELRAQITQLSEQRQQYVAQQLKAKGLDASLALDSALRRAIREQADKQGLQFPDP
jgi:hypothetical protein